MKHCINITKQDFTGLTSPEIVVLTILALLLGFLIYIEVSLIIEMFRGYE